MEAESGKKNQRPQLLAAIAAARAAGGVLLIAKLDRLSRNAGFILALRDSGVQFAGCDMPDANTLTVGLFALIAQHERETSAQRTQDALPAKKARGAPLGTPANLPEDARQLGRDARQRNAREHGGVRQATALILVRQAQGLSCEHSAGKLPPPLALRRAGAGLSPNSRSSAGLTARSFPCWPPRLTPLRPAVTRFTKPAKNRGAPAGGWLFISAWQRAASALQMASS